MEENQPLVAKYVISREDLQEAIHVSFVRSLGRNLKGVAIYWTVPFLAVSGFTAYTIVEERFNALLLVAVFLAASLWCSALEYRYRKALNKMTTAFLDGNGRHLYVGTQTLRLEQEQLFIESDKVKASYKYEIFDNVIPSSKVVLLTIGNFNHIIVSKRSFQCSENFNEFMRQLCDKLDIANVPVID